ncbi:MAG: AEC family transporter [Solobacterium sp.]|nr:AEC family transporter [Solobacterium sp.]MBR0213637.1 AEC family transporter [Solobacterium sp.]
MHLNELFLLQFMMFAEMIVGYLLCKTGILSPKDRSVFSKAVINVFLPCSIVNSFLTRPDSNVLQDFLTVLLVSVLIQVLCTFLAAILYRHTPENRRPILQYATVCSNAGFLGNAVAEGVYGELGLLYGQIYLIPLRIVMWTAGISYFEGQSDFKSKLMKILTHPCIIAVIIGLCIMLTGITLPAALTRTMSSLGRCSTPLIMVFLGMVLAETGFKGMINKETVRFAVLRLIVIPAAVLLLCLVLRIDSFITGLSVLLAAMPAGSTTSVLAEQYHSDVAFASDIVVFTTIGSILLLPAWVMLLQML